MTQPAPNKFIFLDLETTGLDPDLCDILELALVVTDENFYPLYQMDTVFEYITAGYEGVSEIVVKMHEESGLWKECAKSEVMLQPVEEDILKALEELEIPVNSQPPVGNTIHFDRAFLKVYMPRLEAFFHYRNFDVSTITQFTERYLPDVFAGRPVPQKTHRALPDVYESIATLKYYQQRLRYV